MVENMATKNFHFLWKFHKDKQTELAKMFCVSQSDISAYVNGKSEIPVDVLGKIAYRYNVSIDDLTTKDLSIEYDNPQTIGLEQAMNVSARMFPFLTSNKAKNNENFNSAYNITMQALQVEDVQTLDGKICIFEHAIDLYGKAWEESKTYVALSNSISLILFIYAFYSQRNLEIAQELMTKGSLSDLELRQKLLRNPNKPVAINKYENKRKGVFDKYNELVFKNIKLLKQNVKFSDLGDFYLSMCYFQGFTDGDFDYDACVQTAFMMLIQQYDLNNKYAENFLDCI
ncbi:MAG: helix-turn-helix transcriptional regulator [Clostridia bacterium]|nr:helix-turn-helix transcriptional regulator [Clostridia bacterium]